MASRLYLGIAEPGPRNWSISFPAFPGVVTVGDDLRDLLEHARDALESAIEAMEDSGLAIPQDVVADSRSASYEPADYRDPRAVLVQVSVSGRSVRINFTIEDSLLAKLDGLAGRTHASRSALLARGARMVLAAEGGE